MSRKTNLLFQRIAQESYFHQHDAYGGKGLNVITSGPAGATAGGQEREKKEVKAEEGRMSQPDKQVGRGCQIYCWAIYMQYVSRMIKSY